MTGEGRPDPAPAASERVRLDRWLFAARIFRSRSDAHQACSGGHVKLNGRSAKPAHPVGIGDQIAAVAPRGKVVLIVRRVSERRVSPSLARELYEDHSPPPPARDPELPQRERGSGRPSAAERRALARMKHQHLTEHGE